jgi:hypothetical protein
MRIVETLFASSLVALFGSSALGQQGPKEAVFVGPWSITTTYKADRFENCTMSRTGGEVNSSFLLTKDEMLLELDSPKWRLERGKTYPVKLVIGSRSYDAKALAESKTATIQLGDRTLTEALKIGASLDVHGEGATIRIPLDGSAAGFNRLNMCFNKNSHTDAETNPFVAPSQRP